MRVQLVAVDPADFTELAGHPLGEVNSRRVAEYRAMAESEDHAGWSYIVTVGPCHAVLDGRHRVSAARALGVRPLVLNVSEAEYERLSGDGCLPAMSLDEIARVVIERYRRSRGTMRA